MAADASDERNRIPVHFRRRFLALLLVTVAGGWAVGIAGTVSFSSSGWMFNASTWVVVGFVIVAELNPLITPQRWDVTGVSTSQAFLLALLLENGTCLIFGCIVVSALVADWGKGKALWRTAFNIGQYALSYAATAWTLRAFHLLAGTGGGVHIDGRSILPILLAGTVYTVVNNAFVDLFIAMIEKVDVVEVALRDPAYQISSGLALTSVAPLIVVVMQRSSWLVPLLAVPLAALYVSVAMSRDRDRQSLHDGLTGLPNRTLLRQRAEEALADADRDGTTVGLLLLDLNRFKEVNDTLGHHVGDMLLVRLADRLRDMVRPGDTVARLGGDEFALLLPALEDPSVAIEIAARVETTLARSVEYGGLLLETEASVGVATYPQHAQEFDTLIQRADVAMYQAKGSRRSMCVYDVEEDHHSAERLALLGDLRRALDEGGLELHYQPKAETSTGRISGVEALVRWRHPTRGPVPPDEFVPLAEQTGLMGPLTKYVLDAAIAQCAAWACDGLQVDVAVNIAASDLVDRQFVTYVRDCLQRHGLPGTQLVLEVTERVIAGDDRRALATLRELTAVGIRVSLDDFGTGYSSLGRLEALPVTEIKIDRSFVARLDVVDDAPIVRSVVELGHALGLLVVAEGVETARAWEALAGYQCDEIQGWHLARPMAGDAMTSWLRDRSTRLGAETLREIGAVAG